MLTIEQATHLASLPELSDTTELDAWVKQRMVEYVAGAASQDIVWQPDQFGKSDMADWISEDLFAGAQRHKARALCERAGWPS